MGKVDVLHFTGDPGADEFLARDPLALLVGMLLDQQVPMEWAFRSPFLLRERLSQDHLDAGRIAAMDPEVLAKVFAQKPALHRYPASMAKRVHALCGYLVDHHGGDAERVWAEASTGKDLFDRLNSLPGFGREKTMVYIAVLGRRLDVRPDGWEAYAADWPTIADAERPGAIEKIREAKAAWKASGKKSGKKPDKKQVAGAVKTPVTKSAPAGSKPPRTKPPGTKPKAARTKAKAPGGKPPPSGWPAG